MILLGLLVISGLVAYWGMNQGLYVMLGRCLMAALAIAAGVGFAGPVRSLMPSDNPYLYGPCLLGIAGALYLLQRALIEACVGEGAVHLPAVIDRLGGVIGGFGFGMMGLSYIALVAITFPLPEPVDAYTSELRQVSHVAVRAARVVGVFAGTGEPITLENILPHEPVASSEPA